MMIGITYEDNLAQCFCSPFSLLVYMFFMSGLGLGSFPYRRSNCSPSSTLPIIQFKVLVTGWVFFFFTIKGTKIVYLINQMESCISIFSFFLTMIIIPRFKLIRYYKVFSFNSQICETL